MYKSIPALILVTLLAVNTGIGSPVPAAQHADLLNGVDSIARQTSPGSQPKELQKPEPAGSSSGIGKAAMRCRLLSATTAFRFSGGEKRYRKTAGIIVQQGIVMPFQSAIPGALLYTSTPSAKLHGEYTSQDSILNTLPCTLPARSSKHLQRIWVNYLLGNFIFGEGPENILFPTGSEVGNSLRNSAILSKALRAYLDTLPTLPRHPFEFRSVFSTPEFMTVLHKPFSLQHFVGSADVQIQQISDSVFLMNVYNITSKTSADLYSSVFSSNLWLSSDPRQQIPQPFANISQVFQLTFSLEELEALAQKSDKKLRKSE